MYLGPDTACSLSARSTVRYIGNNAEGLLTDLALRKSWRMFLEQGPRRIEANGIMGNF